MGLFSSGSAKRAAEVQAGKQRQAGALVKEEAEKASALYNPYASAGTAALNSYTSGVEALRPQSEEMYTLAKQQDPILAKILSDDLYAYKDTPGYEFRERQGRESLENSAVAKGGLFSGNTGIALQEYGQDYATSEYDNYLRRLYDQMNGVGTQMQGRQVALDSGYQNANAYLPVMEQGFNAVNNQANIGTNAANQRAGYITGEGDAYAEGMTTKSNQLMSLGSGILQAAGTAAGAMIGGPVGASIGGQIGGALGGQPQTFQPSQPTALPQQAKEWINPDMVRNQPQYLSNQGYGARMTQQPALTTADSAFMANIANQPQQRSQSSYRPIYQ
jgi:hypothetical protein